MSENINGFAFPFKINPSTGGVLTADGSDKIKANIKQLLLTGIGERVMRRKYGGGIRQLLHDANNDTLRALVQHQIATAIGQHEPRVQVKEIRTSIELGVLTVELYYVIRKTQEPQSISLPITLGSP